MLKRIVSLFLVCAMLLPCLAGCSSDTAGDTTVPTTPTVMREPEDVGITEEFISALDQAVIMLVGSENCYVKGLLQVMESPAPSRIGDTLYIPAAFVAKSLGAEAAWNEDTRTLTVTWKDLTLEISDGADHFLVNGKSVTLDSTTVTLGSDPLIPAEPYCQALGQSVTCKGDLVIVGADPDAAAQGVPEEVSGSVYSAMGANLAPVSAITEPMTEQGSYAQRAARSKSIVIDPSLAPLSTNPDELVAAAGCLYIENLSIQPAVNDFYDCSMTVYNYLGYGYGSVEVYDKDDNLVEIEQIKPFEGQKSSVIGAITDVWVLMEDMEKAISNGDLDYLNYRTSLNSSITDITVKVPVGGYVFVTCNPNHSQYVSLYNAVHALVEVAMATGDLASLATSSGSTDTFKDMLKDHVTDTLMQNGPVAAQICAEFNNLISRVADSCSAWDMPAYVQSTCAELLDLFQRAEIDFGQLLADAAKNAATDVGDAGIQQALTTMAPFTGAALKSWDVICNISNLFCMFQDFQAMGKTTSLILETADWKRAYAQILREHESGFNLRFLLAYINNDLVPELAVIDAVAHFGSTVEFYSYQNRQVVQFTDSYGNTDIGVAYASFNYVEQGGIMVRGNMHQGYTSLNYASLQNNAFVATDIFNDDIAACEYDYSKATFSYNGFSVPSWYYDAKIEELEKKYEPRTVWVDGFSDGYDLTEANISAVFGS